MKQRPELTHHQFEPAPPMTLYVIQCGDYVKIGVASSVDRRMDEIRALNPHPIVCILRRTVARHRVFQVEKEVHVAFREYAHHREWFRAPPLEEIRAAVKRAIQEAAKLDRLDRPRIEASNAKMREMVRTGQYPSQALTEEASSV